MLVYVICYGAAMLFAFSAHFTLSGMSLLLAAVYLYLREYGKSGNPLHLRGLFSLFYVGGEGISCLKLSRLQTEWSLETWACFFVAFAAFWNVYALAEKKFGYGKEKKFYYLTNFSNIGNRRGYMYEFRYIYSEELQETSTI